MSYLSKNPDARKSQDGGLAALTAGSELPWEVRTTLSPQSLRRW